MKIIFSIPGEPRGKQRPKFSNFGGNVSTRTPEETVLYENRVIMEYRRQCGNVKFSDDAALEMNVTAYYLIPKSTSQKKKEKMHNGSIVPIKKPDVDNILKIIADSLNKIAYRDDSQIATVYVRKLYSYNPRVEVEIEDDEE
jgi:Holliday junction resolvase RusA-like endonuclease